MSDVVDLEAPGLRIDYDRERPRATVELDEGAVLAVSVEYDKKARKWLAKLELYDAAEGGRMSVAVVDAENLSKLMRPKYADFRALLRERLPSIDSKRLKLAEFIGKLRPVIDGLKERYRRWVEKARERRREMVEALKRKYASEFERINEDPVKAILEVVDMYHVGDEVPKHQLVAVIASRFLPKEYRLHAVITGPSSAGKNNLVRAFKKVTPSKWWLEVTRLTAHALDYMPTSIGRQILYIQEYEGLGQAKYSARITLSEGKLTVAYVRRNEKTGELETVNKSLAGVPVLITTTTAVQIDEDMENRTFYISPDTSEGQTRRVIEYEMMAATPEGKRKLKEAEEKARILRLWFRTLKKYDVIVPPELSAELASALPLTVRVRRDFRKLLAAVMAIAVLSQHKREKVVFDGKEYLIAEREDVEYVRRWFLPSISEQIEGLTENLKKVLECISRLGKQYVTTTDVEMRKCVNVGPKQLRRYLESLVEKGFLTVDTKTRPYKYYLSEEGGGLESFIKGKEANSLTEKVMIHDLYMTSRNSTREFHAEEKRPKGHPDQTHKISIEGLVGHAYEKVLREYVGAVPWSRLKDDLMVWFDLGEDEAEELIELLINEELIREKRVEGEVEPWLEPVRED
ncbi:MAG: hypothetical protein J7J20_04675 [Desulfurococcales archaeon]|nr:hypothetical protein [Desulfurococcales archaeon]